MKGDTPEQRAWARRYEENYQLRVRLNIKCKHCGLAVVEFGPQLYHKTSGLIKCDPDISKGTKAEVEKESDEQADS